MHCCKPLNQRLCTSRTLAYCAVFLVYKCQLLCLLLMLVEFSFGFYLVIFVGWRSQWHNVEFVSVYDSYFLLLRIAPRTISGTVNDKRLIAIAIRAIHKVAGAWTLDCQCRECCYRACGVTVDTLTVGHVEWLTHGPPATHGVDRLMFTI